MNIFVGNLPFTASESDLRTLFADYGDIQSVAVITGSAIVLLDPADPAARGCTACPAGSSAAAGDNVCTAFASSGVSIGANVGGGGALSLLSATVETNSRVTPTAAAPIARISFAGGAAAEWCRVDPSGSSGRTRSGRLDFFRNAMSRGG